MDRKRRSTVEVSAEEAALSNATMLSGEEEKVLRMRLGVAVSDLHAPLPGAAGMDLPIADELLLLEMQLFKAYRKRAVPTRPSALRAPPAAEKTKHKIIRALRKKK